jgi:TonB family protein
LADPERRELRAKYSSMLEEGIAHLDRALQIDPRYVDAMTYMNLLVRERADLRDTKEQWDADVDVANDWVQKSIDAKKAQNMIVRPLAIKPVSMAEPVYPPQARQARIEGMVRFTLKIAKDGSIQDIQLVSGHPLLVKAALEAVKQYVYDPVLVNGNPVEALTQVDVHFALGTQ